MTTPWQEQLDKVFPGSKTPLEFESINRARIKTVDGWDAKPLYFTVGGTSFEFFSIGQLSKALGNRSPITLRKWEQEGTLPKSIFIKPAATPNGRRRMYTRGMVEGLIRIAKEEGVLFPHKGIRLSDTHFSERAKELFSKESERFRKK